MEESSVKRRVVAIGVLEEGSSTCWMGVRAGTLMGGRDDVVGWVFEEMVFAGGVFTRVLGGELPLDGENPGG